MRPEPPGQYHPLSIKSTLLAAGHNKDYVQACAPLVTSMSDMVPTDEMKEVVAAGPVSIEGRSLEESEEDCLISLKSGFLSF